MDPADKFTVTMMEGVTKMAASMTSPIASRTKFRLLGSGDEVDADGETLLELVGQSHLLQMVNYPMSKRGQLSLRQVINLDKSGQFDLSWRCW